MVVPSGGANNFDSTAFRPPFDRHAGAYARGHGGLAPPSGCMIVHNNNNIIVSGEAILSAENSGKPLGGRGPAPNPAGGAHVQRSPDPLAGGERGCCPVPRTQLRSQPSALRSCPNEISWSRPCCHSSAIPPRYDHWTTIITTVATAALIN